MFRSLKAAAICSGALMFGIFLGATSSPSRAHADESPSAEAPSRKSELPPPPTDPKKKMPGDACKSSDECQRHHSCVKVDATSSVCQAPPRHRLPPGAVT